MTTAAGCAMMAVRSETETVAQAEPKRRGNMITHETTIVIHRPVEQVFAFASDPRNDLKWSEGALDSRQITDGPVGVGTKVAQVYAFLGRRMEGQLEITEYEPNARLTKKVTDGPFPLELSLSLKPDGGDTRATGRIEMKPGGFFAMAEPLVAGNLRKRFESDMAALKAAVENS
jgi:hypothetical protein